MVKNLAGWEKGISVYVGLGVGIEENCRYLAQARQYGYSRLFTSLHIGEADPVVLAKEFGMVMKTARDLGFSVTADVSPRTFALLGIAPGDYRAFRDWGVDVIRLDYGFSPEEIAGVSRESGLLVELNASTIGPADLEGLLAAGVLPDSLRACHNFYPRVETGLSLDFFLQQSRMWQQAGVPVIAFIPSLTRPRGPMKSGLPTLEDHRRLPAWVGAKHLLATGLVDGVIFGDSMVSEKELSRVAELLRDRIDLRVEVLNGISRQEKALLDLVHTQRADAGEYAVRSQEAREDCTSIVSPRNNYFRLRGSVTVDNEKYFRYMGELQVTLRDLPPDDRVNVIARVVQEELFLLDYIRPGQKFRFCEEIG